MFFQIELLILILMLATFVCLLLFAKMPSGICLMASAFVGMILGTIFNGTDFSFRYLIEGAFGYLDTIITICFAMMFVGALKASGGLEYLSVKIVKLFRKTPSLLLICLAIIVMFPAMVTGSAICAAITTGTIVLPILIKWGVPKNKAAAFVVAEAILGEVAPPINVPAMVICDAVDQPYNDFTLPLLLLTVPLALIIAVVLCRKYVKSINDDEINNIVNTNLDVNFCSIIPLIIIVAFIVGEIFFPKILGIIGLTTMFAVCTILAFVTGRKLKFFEKGNKNTVVGNLLDSIGEAMSIMGLLMGVGMFMAIIALNGVRGYLVCNCLLLPQSLQVITTSIILPLLGGISSYGSVSIIGGPLFMSLYTKFKGTLLIGGFSLLASIGDFLPPSAISASYMAEKVEAKSWANVTLAGLPAIIIMFVYGIIYSFLFGYISFNDATLNDKLYLIYFGIMIVVSIVAIVVYEIILKSINKKKMIKEEE